MRAVIIGLRLLTSFKYNQIKAKTGVLALIAYYIYSRAKDISQLAIHNIYELLKHIGDKLRSSQPLKIASSFVESATIHDLILKNSIETIEDAATPILKELSITLTCIIIENITYNYRDLIHLFKIIRSKAPLKLALLENNKIERLQLYNQID